jgi:cytohesin
MKHILITTIAAVVLVGCGESQQSAPPAEAKPVEPVAEAATPEPPTAKAPDISIRKAVESGNLKAVKQHIAAGANLNKKDFKEGITLLHRAADYGHKEIVELLIANGADVNVGRTLLDNEMKIYYGETPLDNALSVWEDDSPEVKAAKKETAKLLRKHGGKTREELGAEESIHIAARAGHIEAVKKHLTGGVDVNAKQQRSGDAALHNAANGGHKEIVELLIAAGADVKLEDSWGQSSLHNAANNGHKEIVELLIAKGADVNAKDEDGKTPLDDANEVWEDASPEDKAAKKEIATLLRKHGGKSGAEDSIHAAAWVGNVEAVQQHLDSGVDVNTKNKLGRTPMLYAIQGGHKEIAELLISKGAIQVPRIRINDAVRQSNIEAIKQHLLRSAEVSRH